MPTFREFSESLCMLYSFDFLINSMLLLFDNVKWFKFYSLELRRKFKIDNLRVPKCILMQVCAAFLVKGTF